MSNNLDPRKRRNDVLGFVLRNNIQLENKQILEVGSNVGEFLSGIKSYNPSCMDAIELDGANQKALENICDNVIIGNAEKTDQIPYDKYDIIFMLDVLEHFIDPIAFINNLSAKMKKGGVVIVSLPNHSHWRIILSLLRDEMYYQKSGPLDYTHYHFFTHKTLLDFMKETNFKIIKHERKKAGKNKYLNMLTFNLCKHLFTFQNFYILQKA